jgi:hypothetical protein
VSPYRGSGREGGEGVRVLDWVFGIWNGVEGRGSETELTEITGIGKREAGEILFNPVNSVFQAPAARRGHETGLTGFTKLGKEKRRNSV